MRAHPRRSTPFPPKGGSPGAGGSALVGSTPPILLPSRVRAAGVGGASPPSAGESPPWSSQQSNATLQGSLAGASAAGSAAESLTLSSSPADSEGPGLSWLRPAAAGRGDSGGAAAALEAAPSDAGHPLGERTGMLRPQYGQVGPQTSRHTPFLQIRSSDNACLAFVAIRRSYLVFCVSALGWVHRGEPLAYESI